MPDPEQGLHLRDYTHVLIRRWKIVLLLLLGTFACTCIYMLRLYPLFQSTTTIQLESEKGLSFSQPVLMDYTWFDEKWISTQVRVMKSRTVVEKIVKKLGLRLQMKPEDRMFHILVRKWVPSAIPGCLKFKSLGVAEEARPGAYQAVFERGNCFIVYDAKKKEIGRGEAGRIFRHPQFSFVIEGVAAAGRAFTFNVLPLRNITEGLQGSLAITPVRGSALINVAASWKDREIARDIANAVVEEYKEAVVSKKTREASQVLAFVEDQLILTEKDLQKAEENLKNFKGKQKVVLLEGEVKTALDQVAGYEKEYRSLESYRKQAEIVLSALRSPEGFAEQEAVFSMGAGLNNEYLRELGKKLSDMQNQKAALTIVFKEEHPKVLQVNREIETVKKSIVGEITSLIQSLKMKERGLQESLRKFEKKVELLPAVEKELFNLERIVKVGQGVNSFLLQKRAELSVTKASLLANVFVVDPAIVPRKYIEPNVWEKLLWALLIGSVLGVGTAFFLEYLDTTVRTPEQLKRVTDLPYLGAIYHEGKGSSNGDLKMLEMPYSHIAEAFRTIKTNLLFSALGEAKKAFLLTSCGPREGKTFVTANLAAALAQSNRKVLLVETDLRNPTMRRIFAGTKSPGLTNILISEEIKLEGLPLQKTALANLEFISCGERPPNPSELLGSEKMEKFLSLVKDSYDFILLDSPPAYLASDSLVLGQKVDGVVFVVRSGRSEREILKETINRFCNLRIRVLGVILNDIPRGEGRYYYYKYSYYYGGNGRGEKKKKKARSSHKKLSSSEVL